MFKTLLLGLLLLLTGHFQVLGQECVWLNTSAAPGHQASYFSVVDDSSNVIMAGNYSGPFTLGSHVFSKVYTTFNPNYFIVIYDRDGNYKYSWEPSEASSSGLYIESLETDKNNNVYAAGYYVGNITLGGGNTLNNNSSTIYSNFVIKFNPELQVQWARDFGRKTNFGTASTTEVAADGSLNVVVGFHYHQGTGFPSVSDSIYNTNNSRQNVGLVKYNSSGTFQWARGFGGKSEEKIFDLDCDVAGNTYLLMKSDSTFIAGTDTLKGNGETIIKVSPSGAVLRAIKNRSPGTTYLTEMQPGGIAVGENGSLATTGTFSDTAYFQGTTLVATGLRANNNFNRYNSYVAYYDTHLQLRWIRKESPDSLSSSTRPIGRISVKNDYVFFGGLLYYNTHWGSFPLIHYKASYPNYTGYTLYIAKADSLGNFLWAFSGGIGLGRVRIDADLDGNVYLAGAYSIYIEIFDKSASSGSTSGNNSEFYVAKVGDYRITRGEVYPGPYCAGDSIRIPYTKFGNYDTANYFHAELSDEDGNFEGNHRELGRLKSDTDGVITGILPNFEVASSANYRIRVRATYPQVQSFYKRDTLRLLIYSRDSADAGPDRAICRGETIQLKTFGGTKWHWNPPGLQNDSTSRKINVFPLADTQYRIAISDSSGCGVTDTDYVWVRLRSPLKVNPIRDTVICRGQAVLLAATGTGGDSLNYDFTWDQGIGSMPAKIISPDSTTTYRVILSDHCTEKSDTGYVTITVNIRPPLSLMATTDTTICKGQQMHLLAAGYGGDSTARVFSWDQGLGNGPGHIVSPDSTTIYTVILSDNCMPEKTASVTVTVRPPLSISLRSDTTICIGQTVDLIANTSGGDVANYNINWNPGNATGNSQTFYPDSTTRYTVILNDNCSSDPDTALVTVTVRLPLSVSLNTDSTICNGQSMLLSAFASGGDSTYSYLWDNGDAVNSKIVSPSATTTYLLVTSDNCTIKSDSHYVKVTVRPDLEVIPLPDTTLCFGQPVTLFAVAKGGDTASHKFSWDQNLGDTNYVNISLTQTTSYRVIASDNCSAADTGNVTINLRQPLQALPMPDTTICKGRPVQLFANASGGDLSNYNFTWDQGLGDTNFVNVDPVINTIYRVILSDNCTVANDTAFVKISVRPALDLTMPPDTTICRGQSFSFAVFGSGGDTANHLFNWKNNLGSGQSKTVSPLKSTAYSVILSDNCTLLNDSAVITVNVREPLKVKVDPDVTLCHGKALTIHAFASGGDSSAYKFTWDNGAGTGDSVQVTPLKTTNYKVVLSDNCTVQNDSTEIVVTVLDALGVTVTPDTVHVCAGEMIKLSAKGTGGDSISYLFTWDHGMGTGKDKQFNVSATGKYAVELSDGCSLPAYDTVDIRVEPLPLPDFNTAILEGCEPLDVEFKNLSVFPIGSKMLWNFGDGIASTFIDAKHQYMKAGLYNVKLHITTPFGCVDSLEKASLIKVNPVPKVNFKATPGVAKLSSPRINFSNFTAQSIAYNWTFGDGLTFLINNRDQISHDYPDTGNYIVSLEATNNFGCSALKYDTVRIEEDYRFYVPNSFTPNGDGLNDVFGPTTLFTENYELSIYNRWGVKIYSSTGKPWNGKSSSGEEWQQDTYMYIFRSLDQAGNIHNASGTVILLR